ncbi:response regulator transcription factor [Telmatospirillum sp. J64-1]|uniref:response regulator transcription factor n=1 Tax=Telmatospirillum sp. J64-1 TaxID=2502183 RepID=UPI00115D4B62|nr:response regulator [Telmatospirillum sp. J64-1]
MTLGPVHIVDDDEATRDALVWLMQSRNVAAEEYASAEDFLAAWEPGKIGCLLLDLRMEGMSGLELFDRLRELGNRLPVIFLTGHGDISIAVSSLKQGAYDFVEKPFNNNDLVDRVIAAINLEAEQRSREDVRSTLAARLAKLSAREREVMDFILAGKLNKQIAEELGVSMRTVEVHRANLFSKMEVRSAVELAQILSLSN